MNVFSFAKRQDTSHVVDLAFFQNKAKKAIREVVANQVEVKLFYRKDVYFDKKNACIQRNVK